MGYTDFTISKIMPLLKATSQVVDLGAQNNYSHNAGFPAPYMSDWYEDRSVLYECIDLNGENNAIVKDLGEPGIMSEFKWPFGLVVDAGTSEHVGRNGEFSWQAIYNCWRNKFDLCNDHGLIYSENPLTGNWPLHGFNYYTTEFYYQLAEHSGLSIIDIGLHPACHNTRNGWNVWCILRKTGPQFVSQAVFETFNLRTS